MRAVYPEVSLSHELGGRQRALSTLTKWNWRAVGKMKSTENKKELKGAASALGVTQKKGQKKKKHVSVKTQIRSVQRLLNKVTNFCGYLYNLHGFRKVVTERDMYFY